MSIGLTVGLGLRQITLDSQSLADSFGGDLQDGAGSSAESDGDRGSDTTQPVGSGLDGRSTPGTTTADRGIPEGTAIRLAAASNEDTVDPGGPEGLTEGQRRSIEDNAANASDEELDRAIDSLGRRQDELENRNNALDLTAEKAPGAGKTIGGAAGFSAGLRAGFPFGPTGAAVGARAGQFLGEEAGGFLGEQLAETAVQERGFVDEELADVRQTRDILAEERARRSGGPTEPNEPGFNDRDGDGVPDGFDPEPDDPSVGPGTDPSFGDPGGINPTSPPPPANDDASSDDGFPGRDDDNGPDAGASDGDPDAGFSSPF